MPRVAQAAAPAPQPPSVVEPKRLTPQPNRFIQHGDTPFGEEIFDVSEAQAETAVGHCQVDVERTGSAADEAMTQTADSDTRHLTPDPEGTGAQQAMIDGSQEVTAYTEQIQHDAVHRKKPLRVRSRSEPAHLALALPGRLMRDLRSIVFVDAAAPARDRCRRLAISLAPPASGRVRDCGDCERLLEIQYLVLGARSPGQKIRLN